MKKIARIKKRADFLQISADNFRSSQRSLLVLGRKRSGGSSVSKVDENACRVGFTVTKKIGCAVVRNKIRRRFREAVRVVLPSLHLPGYDYVIIAGKSCPDASYKDIVRDLRYAFKEVRNLHRKVKQQKDWEKWQARKAARLVSSEDLEENFSDDDDDDFSESPASAFFNERSFLRLDFDAYGDDE